MQKMPRRYVQLSQGTLDSTVHLHVTLDITSLTVSTLTVSLPAVLQIMTGAHTHQLV